MISTPMSGLFRYDAPVCVEWIAAAMEIVRLTRTASTVLDLASSSKIFAIVRLY
jgi:hypothetical protein